MLLGAHVARLHAPAEGGAALSIVGHLEAAAAEAAREGVALRAAQIFVTGPRDRASRLKAGDAAALAAFAAASGTVLVAHSSYANSNPWRGNPIAAAGIRDELALCAAAGISRLVCHLPHSGPPAWVLRTLPRLIAAPAAPAAPAPPAGGAAAEPPVRLYLEHVSAKGSSFDTAAKVGRLFRGIRRFDPELRHFGFCLDTAHIWGCGADISSYELAEAWLNGLEALGAVLPPDRVMIHLNDSVSPRGSGRDEHAGLLEGAIWAGFRGRPQDSGAAAFADYARRNGTVVILERRPAEKLPADYRTLLGLDPDLAPRAAR